MRGSALEAGKLDTLQTLPGLNKQPRCLGSPGRELDQPRDV